MSRKELLLSIDFFKDKENLVDRILDFEKNHLISLPSKFKYKQTSPVATNNCFISLLRIEDFYSLEIQGENGVKQYQLFPDEHEIDDFFTSNCYDTYTQNFWKRQLHLICD